MLPAHNRRGGTSTTTSGRIHNKLQRHHPSRSCGSSITTRRLLGASVTLNLLLLLLLGWLHQDATIFQARHVQFAGGHPTATQQSGTCYCSSKDDYCLCTPSLAIDLVIQSGPDHVWLVKRRDTGQLACMGGFVEVGETVEHAVQRELREEMGLEIASFDQKLQLLGVYSDPRRDNRRHTVSAVYALQLDGTEQPVAADDARAVERIAMAEIDNHVFFADHQTILLDYVRLVTEQGMPAKRDFAASPGDFANDIQRSVCLPITSTTQQQQQQEKS